MILVISVPFEGHLNVLKHLANSHRHIDFSFLIVGWKNIQLSEESRKGLANEADVNLNCDLHEIYADYDLEETAPMKWTFPRLADVYPRCLELVEQLRPETILYDAFAVEGYFLGKELKVPSICSVPSFYHPYDERMRAGLLPFCTPIPPEFDIKQLEMVSDGPLIRGDFTIVWNHHNGKDKAPNTHFAGYPLRRDIPRKLPRKKRLIYVSFGTVVMNHLWERNKSAQMMVRQIISHLERLHHCDIYVVGQGKIKSKKLHVCDRFDQFHMLSQCDLFITHGGNNSYQEAFLCGTPMLVIPFFGDQIHVAEAVAKQERGMAYALDDNKDPMSTESDKFREIQFEEFKVIIEFAIRRGGSRVWPASDMTALLTGKVPLRGGDLVFGSKTVREKHQTETKQQLGMSIFRPFSEICTEAMRMPRILDIYHDVIRSSEFWTQDTKLEYPNSFRYKKILVEYKEFLDEKKIDYTTEEFRYNGASIKEPDYLRMCLAGIDFFIQKGMQIHFLYDPLSEEDGNITHGYVTDREMIHLDNHYPMTGKVHYYRSVLLKDKLRYVPVI
jgi:hypothetical protein